MLERDLAQDHGDLATLRRPRFVFTRLAARVFVASAYLLVVLVVALLMRSLQAMHGRHDDDRYAQAVCLFAGVMAIPFLVALINVGRRSTTD